jgi:transcriptional regulator with XRE-family HTH domain
MAARLTGKQLAARLGWPASKVSRIEHGLQAVSDDDLTNWLRVTGVPALGRDFLRKEWSAMDTRHLEARAQSRAGDLTSQRRELDLVCRTVSIRWYEPGVIPGSLQTQAYARHIMESWRTVDAAMTSDEVERWLELRAQRSAILTTRKFGRFRYVLLETVLRSHTCPADVWRGQMNHLIRLIAAGTQIGILPLGSPIAPTVLSTQFLVWDDRQFRTDTLVGVLESARAEDVGLADVLWANALKGFDARRLVAQSRDEDAMPASLRGRAGPTIGPRPSPGERYTTQPVPARSNP